MAERIFVVGHAAVTCLGRDMDSTWRGLVAGRSGIRRHAALGLESFLQDSGRHGRGLRAGDGLGGSGDCQALGAVPSSGDGGGPGGVVRVGAGSAGGRAGPASRSGGDGFGVRRARPAGGRAGANGQTAEPGDQPVPRPGDDHQSGRRPDRPAPRGCMGPSAAPANACASGGHAVVLGAMFLRSGEADVALCGAGESAFTPPVVNGFATMKAPAGPEGRRPFRSRIRPRPAGRSASTGPDSSWPRGRGHWSWPPRRPSARLGLEPQAELVGWSTNSDGYHMAMPCRERIVRCLDHGVAARGLEPDRRSITTTPTAPARSSTTGSRPRCSRTSSADSAGRLPISSIKGALGHSLGAASAIEAAVSVRALRDQIIPPTINYRPDPELDLDYVPDQARAARLDHVLTASFGFGGTNNALILRRIPV